MLTNRKNYLNYPKNPHFHRIYDFYTHFPFEPEDDKSTLKHFKHGKNDKGCQLYRVEFEGDCAWSCESAFLHCDPVGLTDLQTVTTNYTNLHKLHEKYPNVQLEIISTEPGCCFTEYIFMNNNGIRIECLDYEEYYDEESNGMKYDIAEDCHWLYTKCYPNDDHSDEEILVHDFKL